jgi:hypothetical protein
MDCGLLSAATTDCGLLAAPLEVGLCCHFTVPVRDGIPALGEGFGAFSGVSDCAVLDDIGLVFGVDGALGLLIEPKPLNSGTPSIEGIAVGVEGVTGRSESNLASVLLGVSSRFEFKAGVFSCG